MGNDDKARLKRWKDVASSLDSHKVSALRSDLGMASCGLWDPSQDEIDRLKEAAEEEGLAIYNQASGPSTMGGDNYTVRIE